MVSRIWRVYRGVRTVKRICPSSLCTPLAYTWAAGSFWEKVMTGFPAAWAASITRWAWSQSRFTQLIWAWAKIFSLEAK